jgi:hypothetical protein
MHKKILVCLLMLAPGVHAQTFSESITKELAFEKKSTANALMISNIFGGVKVIAYEGDKILLEVKKSVSAKTDARLEKGKAEVQLGIIDRADTLILYVRDGCHEFTKAGSGRHGKGWQRKGWGYQTNADNCNLTYDYKMDFIVKVPASLHLDIGTINNGDIVVENVEGIVRVRNVNGSIRLVNLKSEADAHTVNGDVDIEYAQNPGKDCRFYTLNGDINALFVQGLSANVNFKTFNGSFYTNISKMETLPIKLEKATHGDGVKYKINGNHYQVGRGGSLLDFETFNGNVYLKEKSN